ncbi:MAG: hypothetical protein U0802_19540, partial [Candidatus Binatia bacterium]
RPTALARGGGAGRGQPATVPVGASPVVAQLVNRDGTCWASTFVAPSASGPTRFKAKSPP